MKLENFKFFQKKSKNEIPVKLLTQWLKKPSHSNSGLNHLIFDNHQVLDHVIQRTKKSKRQTFEKFRDAYFRSDIQRLSFPKQSVIQAGSDLGHGVIANEQILSNVYLGEYTGIVRKYIPSLDKLNQYLVRYPLKLGILKPLVIDASKCGNHTRFYNHSIKPNAQLVSVISDGIFKMIIISIKRIQNQSQILIDYGRLYWKQIGRTPDVF